MKRMLVWLVLIAMLFTVGPVASAAPSYTYTNEDVMTAVSGMARMPSAYYNMAGIGLESIGDLSAGQAENLTKKMYTVWAFLAPYTYTYNGNKAIKDVMTKDQWVAMTNYISKLTYDYGTPAFYNILLSFLGSAKAITLVKAGVPNSLLGVQFDEAETGKTAYVKVYTTTAVTDDSKVYLADANGAKISTIEKVSTYAGTLASFKEYILAVDYPSAGKNTVQLFGVDSKYAANYFTTSVKVGGGSSTGTTGPNTAAVISKVTAATATLGTPSTIRVTTSLGTAIVKITDSRGNFLASSQTPESTTLTSKTFAINYSFPSAGRLQIYAYAGTISGATVLWNKTKKTASLTVTAAAANATISKLTATTVLRGQDSTVSVVASSSVTRVQLFDAKGDVVGFTRDFTVSGKTRVFKLTYRSNAEGSYKLTAQAGDDIAWNTGKKTGTVKFLAPIVNWVVATKVPRGQHPTITVSASETVVKVELFDASKNLIATQTTKDITGKFVLTPNWTSTTRGTKVIYVKVYDSFGGTGYYKSTVTFT